MFTRIRDPNGHESSLAASPDYYYYYYYYMKMMYMLRDAPYTVHPYLCLCFLRLMIIEITLFLYFFLLCVGRDIALPAHSFVHIFSSFAVSHWGICCDFFVFNHRRFCTIQLFSFIYLFCDTNICCDFLSFFLLVLFFFLAVCELLGFVFIKDSRWHAIFSCAIVAQQFHHTALTNVTVLSCHIMIHRM
jgi:hypothetical protein